eukprot:GHVU01088595.1.p1 GENE.GHVU01088595.1~~GHVU01088595.1.p1  ORF type:complete len:1196 (-),score=85.30 GHVU01088595.1:1591-4887(-)
MSDSQPADNNNSDSRGEKRARLQEVNVSSPEAQINQITIRLKVTREVRLCVDTLRVIAKADTGCDLPVMSATLYGRLQQNNPALKLDYANVEVYAASRNRLTVLGSVVVPLQLGKSNPIETDVIVIKEDVPFFLAYDTLKALGFVVDTINDGLYQVEHEEFIPFLGRADCTSACEVNELSTVSSSVLTSNETQQLNDLLNEFSHVFDPPKVSKLPPIELEVTEKKEIKARRKVFSPDQETEIEKQIASMLEKGIISEAPEPCHYVSPITLARKADGTWRFCINYCRLNKILITDHTVIPLIEELVELVQGCKYFISLDCATGYWQIGLSDNSKTFTTFAYKDKLYFFNVLPFGLTNAPSCFQRRMMKIFHKLWRKGLVIYIDDLLLYAKTFDQCLTNFRYVLKTCSDQNLVLKFKKCSFFPRFVKYLGFSVDGEGLRPLPEKLVVLQHLPPAGDKAELRRLLGLFVYYQRFVSNFSQRALPLTDLLHDATPFFWGEAQDSALADLKGALSTVIQNYHFDPNLETVLDTDASKQAIGAALQQRHEGVLVPVLFLSRKLSATESRWPVSEREAFAIVWAMTKCRRYLIRTRTIVRTDHASLRWLPVSEKPKHIHWACLLAEFDFAIQYRKGSEMEHVDYLSRISLPNTYELLLSDKLELSEVTVSEGDVEAMLQDTANQTEAFRKLQEADDDFNSLREKGLIGVGDGGIWSYKGRIFLPKVLRETYMLCRHYSPFGGHLGSKKLLKTIQRKFKWPHDASDIKSFCQNCVTCQRNDRHSTTSIGGNLQSIGPFDLVALDYIGPLEFNSQFYYILTMICHFTKWTEVAIHQVPAKNKDKVEKVISGEQTFRSFLLTWIVRYGVPARLLTDRGSNFIRAFKDSGERILGCNFITTAPYHPSSNGVVERFNGTFKEMLYKAISTFPHYDFDLLVGLTLLAYRNSVHTSSQETPAYALMGVDLRIPIIYTTQVVGEDRKARIRNLMEYRASIRLQETARRLANITPPSQPPDIKPDDLVLVRVHETKRRHVFTGVQNHPSWSLPRRVVRLKAGGAQVITRSLYTGKEREDSIADVTPVSGDDDHVLYEKSLGNEERRERYSGGLP